jgi:hypothetical protein
MQPAQSPDPSLMMRGIYAVPLVGQIARDIGSDSSNIFYALMIFVTLVVLCVKFWGLAALAMAALTLVPVMFTLLILISRG